MSCLWSTRIPEHTFKAARFITNPIETRLVSAMSPSLNPAHADSVVLVSLPPGNYTAQVSGLNIGTGIALCEIYEVY